MKDFRVVSRTVEGSDNVIRAGVVATAKKRGGQLDVHDGPRP
jgi:hypothetical protein